MSEEQYSNVALLKLVDLFHFMGAAHAVYEHENVLFIYSKGLVDQVGLVWKRQRQKLLDGDNPFLYGVKNFVSMPLSEGQMSLKNGVAPPINEADRPQKWPETSPFQPKEGLYQRLDRVYLWLARLSTGLIRSHGNVSAADQILEWQDEWGAALHSYETHGIAVKEAKTQGMNREMKLFTDLLKNKSKVQTPEELAIYQAGMSHLTKTLGVQVDGDLLSEGAEQ